MPSWGTSKPPTSLTCHAIVSYDGSFRSRRYSSSHRKTTDSPAPADTPTQTQLEKDFAPVQSRRILNWEILQKRPNTSSTVRMAYNVKRWKFIKKLHSLLPIGHKELLRNGLFSNLSSLHPFQVYSKLSTLDVFIARKPSRNPRFWNINNTFRTNTKKIGKRTLTFPRIFWKRLRRNHRMKVWTLLVGIWLLTLQNSRKSVISRPGVQFIYFDVSQMGNSLKHSMEISVYSPHLVTVFPYNRAKRRSISFHSKRSCVHILCWWHCFSRWQIKGCWSQSFRQIDSQEGTQTLRWHLWPTTSISTLYCAPFASGAIRLAARA